MSGGRCIVLTAFGGYDKLIVEKKSFPPPPLSNEVKVSVKACGLNFADVYQRQGLLVDLPKPPFIMGIECSGVVEEVGSDVMSFKKGDRVMCYNSNCGLYAEVVVLSQEKCFLMPTSMTFEEAAAFLVNYLTAYFCLFDIGNLKKDQTVFTHSIAGGVGCAVTQLSKTVENVSVAGTASEGKASAARANGANFVFSYSTFHDDIEKHCINGVDIFIDNLSGSEFTKSLIHVNSLGKLIHIGANCIITGETRSIWAVMRGILGLKNIPVLNLINKNHSVCGLNLAKLWMNNFPRISSAVSKLCELFEAGLLKPQIDSSWNFDQIILATQRLGKRENIGKVILLIDKLENH